MASSPLDMASARSLLFDATKPVVAHCSSRCVRRDFLIDLEARRRFLIDRMRFLARFLAVDVLEAAVLSNHMHLVLATHPDLAELWTNEEVASRYRSLCPDHRWRKRMKIAKDLPAQPEEIAAALAKPRLIAKWRTELCSLSFFHKLLKQKFALQVNSEEGATGHCWEGRFKSIVALDIPAIIAHMVYVALNPVRAALADALDKYEFASVADRVEEIRRRIANGEYAGEVSQARARLREAKLLPAISCDPGPTVRAMSTLPQGLANPWYGGNVPAVIEGASLAAFLRDVDAEGRVPVLGKVGRIPDSTPRILDVLDAELAACAGAEHIARELARAPVASEKAASTELNSTAWVSTDSGSSSEAASPRMEVARALMSQLDPAMSRTKSGMPWGNLSGAARELARHARAMGRQFVVGIFGRLEDGGVRRVRAAPNDEDTQRVHCKREPGPCLA